MTSFVIVGGGQAGRRAAECLRAGDPHASICVVGDEPHLPYDRPSLSKAALLEARHEPAAFIRGEDFYSRQRIDLRLGVRAVAIDRERRLVVLDDGNTLAYDRLLLATGSRVRRLPGTGLHYLRTLDDARALRSRLLPGKSIAIVGGGFIGLEVAATAATLGCRVTLIEPADRVLKRGMPEIVSAHVTALHRRHGVEICLGAGVSAVEARPDGVELAFGARSVQADVAVAGIGVIPNTELAQDAGIEVNDGIVVDAQCRTNDPHIFAAGEVTRHHVPLLGRSLRVESWQVAEKQPEAAAAAMLGNDAAYGEMPWLWSDQYECNIQTLGVFDPDMTLVVRGDPDAGPFSVIGLDDSGAIGAAATIDNGRDMAVLKRLVGMKGLDSDRLGDIGTPLRSLLSR